ncbi:MAG: pyruvate kinase [Maribacter sp.]|nr:pyruvate kinase [Maribacter sp.]
MKIQKIDKELSAILKIIIDSEASLEILVSQIHGDYRQSAKNLCRYLLLRSFDLRKYQDSLSDLGVSSLRTAEGYVLSNLYNVVKNLKLIQGIPFENNLNLEIIGYKKSKWLVKKHANMLFSQSHKKHFTEIMVTLPNEAAEDAQIVREMVQNGMQIARINLSHGNMDIWMKMVQIIRDISEEINQKVKIYIDLSGPKIRTSKIEIRNKKNKIKDRISIRVGEHILLTKKTTLGKSSSFGKNDEQLEMAEVGISIPEIIDDLKIGDQVLFDDGMIRSHVIAKNEEDVELVLTNCYKLKLGSHKGINLPNTKLRLPSLTKQDIEFLPFVCKHADMLGYSFVRTREDVSNLYKQLNTIAAIDMGIVFKIENQEAFENLPQILLEGMTRNKIGVMIARGDLAVEIGFERISEVQNEILWICEAGHIPVIWATQVLENLAKTGIPTRAEISDAAQGAQAECVMLNKGDYINDAIKVLKNILVKMKEHSSKKKNASRSLKIAKTAINQLLGNNFTLPVQAKTP